MRYQVTQPRTQREGHIDPIILKMGHTSVNEDQKSTNSYVSSTELGDRDIAAAIVSEHAQLVDPLLEKRVLRKIDLYLIPFMWIGYGLVYYDKVCLLEIWIRGCRLNPNRQSSEAQSCSDSQKTCLLPSWTSRQLPQLPPLKGSVGQPPSFTSACLPGFTP